MRLAVFTSHFPGRVNTFFARDMRALIDAGIDVDVLPLHPLDASLWRHVPSLLDPDVLPRERVHHLPRGRGWRGLSPRPLSRLAGFARDLMAIERDALRFGAGVAAKSVYALASAWEWAGRLEGRVDHVLAYWGNYAATAAYAFQRLTNPRTPFSMLLHAGTDLYRTPAFLAEKLLYADNVFVVCEFNRDFIRRHYARIYDRIAPKIRVHHLGLDLDTFECAPRRSTAPFVLAVGSLEPSKGFDVLLRAMAELRRHGLAAPLMIVGVGSERGRLDRLVSELELGGVHFEDWMPFERVRQLMSRATLLVHPSNGLGDAVPTVIKECLALGTPVVASAVAGIPELLDHGRCGLLAPAGDPRALAQAMATMWRDAALRHRVAVAGRAHAEARFDIRKTGTHWAAELKATPRRHDPMSPRLQPAGPPVPRESVTSDLPSPP